jgi:hypothetical protein
VIPGESPGASSSRTRWALIAAALQLSGCGNFHQDLSVAKWYEAGSPVPPQDRFRGDFRVAQIEAGEGEPVKPGDLVKVRLQMTTGLHGPAETPEFQPRIMWLWVGRELVRTDWKSQNEAELTFGSLGSARVRRTLIGQRLHAQFSIELEPGAEGSTNALPQYAIRTDSLGFETLKGAYRDSHQVMNPRRWPGIELGRYSAVASARLEVLNICRARLLHRTAKMTQFGLILNYGEPGYAMHREGTLGWTAIEAQCPAPDGPVRFQAGPFYYAGDAGSHRLADWSSSYIHLRSPLQYPEEWEAVGFVPADVLNQRLGPLHKQINDLQTAQRQADLRCTVSNQCEGAEQTAKRRQQLGRLRAEEAQQKKALDCAFVKRCN